MHRKTLGIGVIGMGWMGQVHARSYSMVAQRFPDDGVGARLVICSDNVEARAQSARDTLGFACATTRWQDVFEHPDVQIVNVATPNNLHVEIVQAAAAAGKHIFCEKPVGRSPDETAQIEAIARRAGLMSFVGFNYRWAPMVLHAKQLIDEGRLGALTQYRGRFFSMYGSDPLGLLSWRFDREIAGYGVLGDIMAHVTDMAHYLCGGVKRLVSNSHTFIGERPKSPSRAKARIIRAARRMIPKALSATKIMRARWSSLKTARAAHLKSRARYSGPRTRWPLSSTARRGRSTGISSV